ncbi:alpha/beta hydrolase [soil metagenome]
MPSFLSNLVPVFLRVTGANRTLTSAARAEKHIVKAARRRPWVRPPNYVADRTRLTVAEAEVGAGTMPVATLAPRTGESRGAVIYLHGGSWVNEIAPQHWQLTTQIATEASTTVIVPIYPLLPSPAATAEHVVAAVVELAIAARAEHGGVCLAGDSAGGQIALSAALALRDAGVVVPRTILISPALDLSMKNPEMDAVQPSDPWLAKSGNRVFIDAWRGALPVSDPRVSPLEGDLTGLGPLTIFSGTRDILNPDARLLVSKARATGVSVDYREEAGLVHVYPLTPTSEAREARAAIVSQLTVR